MKTSTSLTAPAVGSCTVESAPKRPQWDAYIERGLSLLRTQTGSSSKRLASLIAKLTIIFVAVSLIVSAPLVSSADPIDDALFEVVGCETGYTYDYTVIDPMGLHFGGFQFDLGTWWAVGGQGYPHQASPEEQWHRARILYLEKGRQPWPHC